MDNLEGEVIGEEVHEGALGDDIFSADEDGADMLVLDVRYDGIKICVWKFFHKLLSDRVLFFRSFFLFYQNHGGNGNDGGNAEGNSDNGNADAAEDCPPRISRIAAIADLIGADDIVVCGIGSISCYHSDGRRPTEEGIEKTIFFKGGCYGGNFHTVAKVIGGCGRSAAILEGDRIFYGNEDGGDFHVAWRHDESVC